MGASVAEVCGRKGQWQPTLCLLGLAMCWGQRGWGCPGPAWPAATAPTALRTPAAPTAPTAPAALTVPAAPTALTALTAPAAPAAPAHAHYSSGLTTNSYYGKGNNGIP